MAMTGVGGHANGFAATERKDNWWLGPLATVLGLGSFGIYATWAAAQGSHYWIGGAEGTFGGYLSPFYSPVLFSNHGMEGYTGTAPLDHAWLGSWPSWWPSFMPASPAFLILMFPGLFRGTCYYYRKAYYRSFLGTPPGCGVGPVPHNYKGETTLLVVQNLHRYALYIAIGFIFILYYDAFMAFFRGGEFGVGVGSLVLLINPTLLAMYTFGCHSWRHLIGGRMDCFSCSGTGMIQHKAWKKVSWLNARHMQFAWLSLIWVGLSDIYVRLVSMGIITDLNTWSN